MAYMQYMYGLDGGGGVCNVLSPPDPIACILPVYANTSGGPYYMGTVLNVTPASGRWMERFAVQNDDIP